MGRMLYDDPLGWRVKRTMSFADSLWSTEKSNQRSNLHTEKGCFVGKMNCHGDSRRILIGVCYNDATPWTAWLGF